MGLGKAAPPPHRQQARVKCSDVDSYAPYIGAYRARSSAEESA